MCFSLSFFLGGGKNKSNKKLKEKASTYNPSLMIPRMFKLTHPFLLIIITSKTSFSPDKVVVLRSRVSPPSHLWLIFRCGLRSCDEQFGFICFALFFCFFFHTSAGFVSLPVSPPLFDFHLTHVLHLNPPQVKAGLRSYLAEMLL